MMRPHYTLVLTSCGLIGLLSFTLTPARAESPPHACRLFSPMELEYAFHVSVDRGAPRVNTEQLTSCLFRAGRAGTVSILVRLNASKRWIEEQKHRMSGPGRFRRVSGVGDSAFVLDQGENGAILCAFQGEQYLQIAVFRLGDADTVLPVTKELARKALSRR